MLIKALGNTSGIGIIFEDPKRYGQDHLRSWQGLEVTKDPKFLY